MSRPLEGKIALVTGGGRGIGRAIAIEIASAGAHVVVAARTASQIEAVVREIAVARGEATAIRADMSSEADIVALFGRVNDTFGRLDVLINNAAIGAFGPVAEVSAADIDRVFAVNVRGVFLCCREAMRMMIPAGDGVIINISSVVGFKGYANQAIYSSSKHALEGLTKVLAAEAQEHGIRVTSVAPGSTYTDLIRKARPDLDPSILMRPEDVARAVMFALTMSDSAAVDQICIRRRGATPF